MEEELKIVKDGFFVKSIFKTTHFYYFKKIKSINYPKQDYKRYVYIIEFFCDGENHSLSDKNESSCLETYNLIMNAWIEYHSNKQNKFEGIEKKLDALLTHIEVMPGSEEAEKAKNEFIQNI